MGRLFTISGQLRASTVIWLGGDAQNWIFFLFLSCFYTMLISITFVLFKNAYPCLSFFGLMWYCLQAEAIMEALDSSHISEREVCVQWWKLGRWFYGFRLRDESRSRTFSLLDIAMDKEEEVLRVLHRGAIHEVIRVQISVAKPVSTPWSVQSPPTQN